MRRMVMLLETGLVAFTDQIAQIWRVDLDIVTSVRWGVDNAVVCQMDGPRCA